MFKNLAKKKNTETAPNTWEYDMRLKELNTKRMLSGDGIMVHGLIQMLDFLHI